MKNFFGLIFIVFILNQTYAQETVTLNISGLTEEVEKSFIPGDRISFFNYDDGKGSINIIVKVFTSKGSKRFFGSVDLKADETGHYEFNGKVDIKESSKVTFGGDIELLISMPTIFGNEVWTRVTRVKSTLSDPIILDRYTEKADQEYPPRKRLNVNFSAIAYDDDLKKKVEENGDTWRGRERSDYRFKLKNEGDTNWKIDQVMSSGTKTGEEVSAFLTYNDELDLDKKVVMRVEVTTEKGNILWNEVVFESRGMTQVYFGQNYLIIDNASNSGNQTDSGTETNVVNSDQINLNSTIESNNGGNESNGAPVKDSNLSVSNENSDIKDENQVNSVPPLNGGGATDLTTKTEKAACATMNAGDSLVNINGSLVCVQNFRPQGTKGMVGILAMDCNFEIGGTIFPIRGKESIECNKTDGKLVEGVLRANTTFSSSVGTIILKEGAKVKFQGDQLIGASLAENSVLNVNGIEIRCSVNPSLEYDIRFDVKGRLVECTLENALSWTAEDLSITFPKSSRLIYQEGELSKVYCTGESSFQLNDITINVAANSKKWAYEFKTGKLVEVISGKGNSIDLQGKSIPVKEDTEISFNMEEGKTKIEKFFVGKEVTLEVEKGKSTSEVTVKEGKKIVIQGEKVVKAG